MNRSRAFVYDFLSARGGAENLALHVAASVPDLDLVTAWADRAVLDEDQVMASDCITLTTPTRLHGWHALKAIDTFRRRATMLRQYRAVVFSGFYAPLAVAHRRGLSNLYYCHTPPRFAYDLEDFFLAQAHPLLRPAQRALVAWLRDQYAAALADMDRIAANSINVQRRLERYLGLVDVRVIHPPVATERFNWREPQGYYLSCARLEPYKRVDLLIEAFRLMPGRQLVIASGGSDEIRLRRLASGLENIRFTGWLSDEGMREQVAHSIATLYVARDEDFGMSPVESMAAGKPVIGAASGGLLETVMPGETGVLLDEAALCESTAKAAEVIRAAVEALDARRAREMRGACERRAAQFDSGNFDRRFAAFLAGD